MDNAYDTLRTAIEEAKALDHAAEMQANVLADLLMSRLEKVSGYRLKTLKLRLARFNAATRTWKE